ncbi:MAG: hypothetical protein C4547_01170 [Phycisphaerales bacterium]|nr:MAG: hypothetical protein C4547_01170 [Phycisphaerales bacterium]
MLKLDRMFRNGSDCLATVEARDMLGVALHVVDLGGNAIDTTSPAKTLEHGGTYHPSGSTLGLEIN